MLKLALCKSCGRAYDEGETDDEFCADCPADYDPEAQEIVKKMRNIKDLEAE